MKTTSQQREAVLGLFNFIEQVTGVRQAVTKNLSNTEWHQDLGAIDPAIPGIHALWPNAGDSDLLVAVEKLNIPLCPRPAESLIALVRGNWLAADWTESWKEGFGEMTAETDLHEADAVTEEQKAALARRRRLKGLVPVRDGWLEKRKAWLEEREKILANNRLFDRLLLLKTKVAESNLKSEAVLGNYIFTSDTRLTVNQSLAEYPLVVRPLVLTLSSSRANLPLIEVRINPEEPSRFLHGVMQTFADEGVSLSATDPVEKFLESDDPDPVGNAELTDLIRRMTVQFSPACRWHETDQPLESTESGIKFRIEERPVILLQDRPSGLKEAIESIRNQIGSTEDIPRHLLEIVCPGVTPETQKDSDARPTLEQALAATAGEDSEILLTKPANTEQLAIARAIMRNNVVLVQGPPGTGKTHTIANLLGHFLAEGKRVLVTSQTPKALSVVKDKLPDEIKPLCVSMIGEKKDLERTALQLKDKLGSQSLSLLKDRIDTLTTERAGIIERQKTVRLRIFERLQRDNEAVTADDKTMTLPELAVELHRTEALGAEIPGRVEPGVMPLSSDELVALYRTNGIWSAETQRELMFEMPDPKTLPDAQKMDAMRREYDRLCALRDSPADEIESEDSHANASGVTYADFRLSEGISVSIRKEGERVVLDLPDSTALLSAKEDAFIRSILETVIDDAGYREIYLKLADALDETAEAYRRLDKARVTRMTTIEFGGAAPADVLFAAVWFLKNAPDGNRDSLPGFSTVTARGQEGSSKVSVSENTFLSRRPISRHFTKRLILL